MFNKGDILISTPPFSPEVFIVTEVHPERSVNKYSGKRLKDNRPFRLPDVNLKRVGRADDTYLESIETPLTINSVLDKQKKLDYVRTLKPGDTITLFSRGKRSPHKFVALKESRWVYPVTATNDRGTTYRFPLNSVHLPETQGAPSH